MRSNSQPVWPVAIAYFVAVALFSASAAGRICTTAADCPRGFQCLGGGESFDGAAESACISLSCKSNSDCGSGTVCEMGTSTQCISDTDGAQSCGPASACVPQWQAPCTVDTDCGDGFTCVGNGELCDCSGHPQFEGGVATPCDEIPVSHMSPCVGDASCRSSPPPICEAGTSCACTTLRMCQEAKMAPCVVSTDCLPGWACMCPPGGSGDVEIPGDASKSTGSCSAMACEPPNWDLSNLPTNGGTAPGAADGGMPVVSGSDGDAATSAQDAEVPAPEGGGGCSLGRTNPARAPCAPELLLGLACVIGRLTRLAAGTRRVNSSLHRANR
jgi:hypothetical protein